jgi:hypothetical protein
VKRLVNAGFENSLLEAAILIGEKTDQEKATATDLISVSHEDEGHRWAFEFAFDSDEPSTSDLTTWVKEKILDKIDYLMVLEEVGREGPRLVRLSEKSGTNTERSEF